MSFGSWWSALLPGPCRRCRGRHYFARCPLRVADEELKR